MVTPGVYLLGDVSITTAGTQTATVIEDLEGMLAALVSLRFAWGSGGTSCTAYVQCSADQGTTWYDIGNVLFGTASETALLNFSALTPKTTQVVPTDGTLTNDTAVDGLLTDRMRLKVVSVGTYAGNTLLTARLNAR